MRITFDGGNESAYRSQLEREVATELDRLEVAYAYEQQVTVSGQHVRYLPDFTIEGDASHLDLPRWVECKPQQMLYTLRDVTGVTRRAGEYFKADVSVDGLTAADLLARDLQELAKPKRLAELTGDDVLLVGGVQEHQLLTAGLDLPDLPRRELPIDCGTEAGHQAHKRRGETPCLDCRKAKRTADRLRNEDRYRQRWHRRTA